MANQEWSIKIEKGSGGVEFVVDAFGYSPGQPLQAQTGDTVFWNNLTGDTHQPYLSDANGTPAPNGFLSDPIPGGKPSTPAYVVQQNAPTTLYYICKIHPSERGQISVVAS